MKYSEKILSQTVVQLCLDHGVDHIVISPGSRNAPLTIGFTENQLFKTFSIVDERCAAFYALGMAQQLKRPVAVVCTSGSALLNYYPAVAEAFYSDIPLVVISADRPSHLIDVGDGQTIRQEGVFENHILYSANCKEGPTHQTNNETQISSALQTAYHSCGPVHINVPFSEPLYGRVNSTIPVSKITIAKKVPEVDPESIVSLLKDWNAASRKMILVGVLPPNAIEQQFLDHLAKDKSLIVLTETTSNLHHPNFFPAIDQLIAPLEEADFKSLQPEVLITFGGLVVSKKIKAFLRTYAPKSHYHIDAKRSMNTFFALTHAILLEINAFFNSYCSNLELVSSSYRNDWLTVKNKRLKGHKVYINQIEFSDFKAFSLLFDSLPKQTHLQLANSATVRYAQLFDLHEAVAVFCNRGTSGIDGSTSTAIGAAVISELPTILVTGDLSFFYDSNALWNNYIPKNFRIIIVNNSGGGIFRILPGKNDSDNFATYFETKHGLHAAHLATMYGFQYRSAMDEASLIEGLFDFYAASDAPKILEIFTPSEVNDRILLNYFKFIK